MVVVRIINCQEGNTDTLISNLIEVGIWLDLTVHQIFKIIPTLFVRNRKKENVVIEVDY